MEGRKRIAVVGSDARQAAAGRALARAGYAVAGAEQVARADVILLPLPLDESRTPLAQLLRAAKPGAFALGGRLSAQAPEQAVRPECRRGRIPLRSGLLVMAYVFLRALLTESGLKIYSFSEACRLDQMMRAAITMPIIVKASPSLMTIPIIIPSHVAKPTFPLLRRSR